MKERQGYRGKQNSEGKQGGKISSHRAKARHLLLAANLRGKNLKKKKYISGGQRL